MAGGHNVRDRHNIPVLEDVVQYVKASLEEVRFGMTYEGTCEGGISLHGDMRGA